MYYANHLLHIDLKNRNSPTCTWEWCKSDASCAQLLFFYISYVKHALNVCGSR